MTDRDQQPEREPDRRRRRDSRSLSLLRDDDDDEDGTPPPPPPPPPRRDDRWASSSLSLSSSSSSAIPLPRSNLDDDRSRFAATTSSSSASSAPPPRLYGYTLPLPDDELVPRLIGKSGRVARQIQHASGVARIASGHLPLPDRRDRPVPVLEFRGTLTELHNAVQGVRQAVLDTVRPPPLANSLADDIAFGTLHLDDWCVLDPRHLVLLSGPSDRSSMSDLLRTKLPKNHQPLSIELNNRVDTIHWKPIVEPNPVPRRARSPSFSTNNLSESVKKRRVDAIPALPLPLPPPPPKRHVPDSVRNESYDLVIELPFDAAPAVIGRAGRRMREIHDLSKARCRVNADDPTRNPTFCLSGSVQQMMIALAMVQDIVRNEVDRLWCAPWLDEKGRIDFDNGKGNGGGADHGILGKGRRRSPSPPPPPPPPPPPRSSSLKNERRRSSPPPPPPPPPPYASRDRGGW
ncbi:hypothetical protein MVLG_03705 [Microbotryum lychnidis-dioicae p1A1 Lamole]|uniref:K Homology domain-containing protein n=1 Tax=Microbotryum lychnidis-dioicae (strain p1A1 Lamole / MvSl-1064) TaxID=683840 RepID=U5H910_USTV1|nr:hypothetical protein MVLG_03705 [Microbotryum lychnidis-dioicae p1A1 Lamole]|eukprot:KDE05892.1 hypothetical protein MVLG_03705 [Microbotryum lychnidis-dioicae p1A1 Lamole]